MAVSGTNQSKHVVVPTGSVKTRNAQAVYGIGYYGLATYGVGVPTVVPVNQTKNIVGSLVYAGQPIGLLLALTYATPFSVSGGAINQSKS